MTTGPNMIIECPHCGHPEMKAEAYRCLGLFDMSKSLLEKIINPKFSWVKDKFFAEIRNSNRKLSILSGPGY